MYNKESVNCIAGFVHFQLRLNIMQTSAGATRHTR